MSGNGATQSGRDATSARKLIDRVVPADAGDPLVGVVATTYEMEPAFVDTDFLPSVLGLGAWDDRSWTSRIEMQRRLASLHSATFFLEAGRYRGRPRSLLTEVVPVSRPGAGALHAKVLLLVSERSVRFLLGSANLTEPGYRRNREVAAFLAASETKPAQASLILSAVREMPSVLAPWWTAGAETVRGLAVERLEEWKARSGEGSDHDHEWFAWGGAGAPLWQRVLDRWPEGERVERITIVSPFWSDSPGGNPLERLVRALRSRHALLDRADVRLLTEARVETPTRLQPVIPESLATFDARPLGISATVQAVNPAISPEELSGSPDSRPRPLHAKVVLLEGPQTSLAYLGSANFTRRGWGFVAHEKAANIEAGVILRRTGRHRESLRALIPETTGRSVSLDGTAIALTARPPAEAPEPAWPSFLREVWLRPAAASPETLVLSATLAPDAVAGAWSVELPGDGDAAAEVLVRGDGPTEMAPRAEIATGLRDEHVRALLRAGYVIVRWWASAESVEFPINVETSARARLPLAPGSKQPGESQLLQYYQSRIVFEDLFPPPEGWEEPVESAGVERPPGSSVDTSRIQSYQVRDFVEAIRGIREDLRRAAGSTPPVMRLAVLGAVSPVQVAREVAQAVATGSRTPTAGSFQLIEIRSCLYEARAFEGTDRYRDQWRTLLDEGAAEVERQLADVRRAGPTSARDRAALRRYERAVGSLHARATRRER